MTIDFVLLDLTKGYQAKLDPEDYEQAKMLNWQCQVGKYTQYAWSGCRPNRIGLHRFIMKPSPDMCVDHINGDGLDNRRCNLRICTHAQNMINVRRKPRNLMRGVFQKTKTTYYSLISDNGKPKYLGSYRSELDAAIAYNMAAKELYGEFAILNIVQGNHIPIRHYETAHRVTSCKHGHEFNEVNTYVWTSKEGKTRRSCRACERMRYAEQTKKVSK